MFSNYEEEPTIIEETKIRQHDGSIRLCRLFPPSASFGRRPTIRLTSLLEEEDKEKAVQEVVAYLSKLVVKKGEVK